MTSNSTSKEAAEERNNQIFQALPKLGTPEYLALLKTASGRELPAPVLVRALRELCSIREEDGRLSRAAEATIERLIVSEEKYGYLRPLRRKARQMAFKYGEFEVDDLVDAAKIEIAMALVSAKGEGADKAWVRFQLQRLTDAYRTRFGRRGEREEPERASPRTDDDTGESVDPIDEVTGESAPWHGRVSSENLPWLEEFIPRVLAKIPDDRKREVARDLFSANPSPIYSDDPNDTSTLASRYGVSRYTIHRWRDDARAKVLAALQKQNERDIDISWLIDD